MIASQVAASKHGHAICSRTGNVALALLTLHQATQDAAYLADAERLLAWITGNTAAETEGFRGFRLRSRPDISNGHGCRTACRTFSKTVEKIATSQPELRNQLMPE